MARDVIRHRLVLSFEALSDNVTGDDDPDHRARPRAGPGRPAAGAVQRTRSAPERILQRLDWQVIRRLDGLLQGDYRSLFHGNGVDLAALREYQPGDDVRYIDWNVTARMDTPYVREYHEDREITAWFLLDLSPSVDFGTVDTDRQKRTVLVDFVTTLARLLTRRGNRVGAIFYGNQVERTIPARGGRDQVLRLIDDLLGQRPARRRAADRPAPAAGRRRPGDQAPLAGVHHLRLHQRARLGPPARAPPAPARGPGRPPARPARDRSCRTSGRSSWRTPRPASSSTSTPATRGVPAAVQRGGRGAASRRSAPPSGGPASRRSRCRPTTTSFGRSSGWRCSADDG